MLKSTENLSFLRCHVLLNSNTLWTYSRHNLCQIPEKPCEKPFRGKTACHRTSSLHVLLPTAYVYYVYPGNYSLAAHFSCSSIESSLALTEHGLLCRRLGLSEKFCILWPFVSKIIQCFVTFPPIIPKFTSINANLIYFIAVSCA